MKKFLFSLITGLAISATVIVAQNRIGQGTQSVVPLNNGNGGNTGNGFPLTADGNGANFSITNLNTLSASNINAITFNIANLVLTNAAITNLTPTSNQTNYTIVLAAFPNTSVIHMANTNAFLTFQNTNVAGYQASICLRAFTNAIVTRFVLNLSGWATNLNFNYFVTNGTAKWLSVYNLDTTGTNITVSDAGTHPRN